MALRAERAGARSRGTGRLACAGRVRPRRRHPSLEDRALQPDLRHPREGRPPVRRRAQNLHDHPWTPAEIEVLEKPRVLGVLPMIRVLKPEELVEGGDGKVPRPPGCHPDVAARRDLRPLAPCSAGRHDGRGYGIAPRPGVARPYGERGARGESRESRDRLCRPRGRFPAHGHFSPQPDSGLAPQVSLRALDAASEQRRPLAPTRATGRVPLPGGLGRTTFIAPCGPPGPDGRPV